MLKNLQLTSQNKILIVSFSIFIILYFILSMKNKENPPVAKNYPVYADTLIPRGHVLIPIELVNIEAVSGLIDQYGIIDLYSGTDIDSVLIAGRVKVIRAPLNKNQYAVMVTESLSREIMKYKGPFFAVVQNRNMQNVKAPEKENLIKEKTEPLPAIRPRIQANQVEIEYYSGDQ